MKRRRLEITIHRHEVATLQSAELTHRHYCPQCHSEANLLPVQLAARTAGVTPRTIYRWVEENRVHYIEFDDGSVVICENSLSRK